MLDSPPDASMNASTDSHDALGLEVAADLRRRCRPSSTSKVTLPRPGPGVVGRRRELVADELRALGDGDVGAAGDQRERDQRGEAAGDAAAAPLAAATLRRVVRRLASPSSAESSRPRRYPGRRRSSRPYLASRSLIALLPGTSRRDPLEHLSRGRPRRPLGVQRVLQDHHRGGLVDHGTPLLDPSPLGRAA